MARPKQGNGASAREKMLDAFWELLEQVPYHEITVARICSMAQVNHNSFYYHFPNLDGLTREAIDANLVVELPMAILSAGRTGKLEISPILANQDVRARSRRLFLLAGNHGSPQIAKAMKEAIFAFWYELLEIKPDEMDEDARLALSIAFSCIMAILGELSPVFFKDPEEAFARIETLSQLPLARGIAETAFSMTEKHRK